MDPNQDEQQEDEITRTILQSMLQQNQQHPILLPVTQSIIEAILGGQLEVRDVAQPLEEETEEEEERVLGRRRYSAVYDTTTDEDLPSSPKRMRYSPNEVHYFFKLSSGQEFYYTNEDIKPTIINETIEPNPIVRIIIGNLPRGIQNRLNYLAKFRFDENADASPAISFCDLPRELFASTSSCVEIDS